MLEELFALKNLEDGEISTLLQLHSSRMVVIKNFNLWIEILPSDELNHEPWYYLHFSKNENYRVLTDGNQYMMVKPRLGVVLTNREFVEIVNCEVPTKQEVAILIDQMKNALIL